MSNAAFKIGFEVKNMFIRDKAMTDAWIRKQNAALRRFGVIVQRDAKNSIKKGNIKKLVALHLVTKNWLHGAAANSAIAAGTDKPARQESGPPVFWLNHSKRGIRAIFYGAEKIGLDLFVVIGPVGFGVGRPTVPEKIEHGLDGYKKRSFMGPALERKRDQLLESLLKFGVF